MKRVWILVFLMSSLAAAYGDSGVLGNWMNPTGSIIQIYRCDNNVCARLIAIRRDAPSRVDSNNPNAALRKRSLCGLQIGTNFHLSSPGRAEGGRLYDPQSGKTYSGSMTRDGDKLKLRGYVGISLFGRTEIWTQARGNIALCKP